MKIIMDNSSISLRSNNLPAGTLVPVDLDFANSDHPTSGGWFITTAGLLDTRDAYKTNGGVSDLIPVDGYSKVVFKGLMGNVYLACCAFFDNAEQTTGSNAAVVGEAEVQTEYKVNIPAGVPYVRIANNMKANGDGVPGLQVFLEV